MLVDRDALRRQHDLGRFPLSQLATINDDWRAAVGSGWDSIVRLLPRGASYQPELLWQS
jgi:hypothetical protein